MIALAGQAHRWEPKRLRLWLFSIAGRLVRGGRRCGCNSPNDGPGLTRSPPRSPACKPSPSADQPERLHDQGGETPGPWNPAHPARQPDSPPWPAPEITHQPSNSDQHASGAKDRG